MKHLDYHWHLRAKMAAQGMFSTTDLQPHLAWHCEGLCVRMASARRAVVCRRTDR